MSLGRLEGKVAVITGGASGIGKACALRFAQEGAEVVIADLQAERLDSALEEIRSATNGRAVAVPCNVTEEASVSALAEAAMAEFGQIDTLVAAAGISNAAYVSGAQGSGDSMSDGALLNLPLASWNQVLAVNLTGVMLCNRTIARHMVASGRPGTLVNIASSAAKIPLAGAGDYSVSKAGVVMLTQVLAAELMEHQIRVNAIGPGFIETPMTQVMQDSDEGRNNMLGMTPMGRLGTATEIANTALFLASDESSYTSGQTLYPNGGMFVG
ncbi:MAG: SDR family NAD(P)-dependent oxidoreductase [Pseudomonadales bacterium]